MAAWISWQQWYLKWYLLLAAHSCSVLWGWADTQTARLIQVNAWSRDCSSGWRGNQTLLNYTSRRWRKTKSQPYWNSECTYAICICLLGNHWQALLYSSVTHQSYAQRSSSREMWNHVSIGYAGQLCKQPALGREEAEEHSHLTRFSKNTQVQKGFHFQLFDLQLTKEKEIPSRVKMYSVYVLAFFKKNPQLKQRSIVKGGLLLWTNMFVRAAGTF